MAFHQICGLKVSISIQPLQIVASHIMHIYMTSSTFTATTDIHVHFFGITFAVTSSSQEQQRAVCISATHVHRLPRGTSVLCNIFIPILSCLNVYSSSHDVDFKLIFLQIAFILFHRLDFVLLLYARFCNKLFARFHAIILCASECQKRAVCVYVKRTLLYDL